MVGRGRKREKLRLTEAVGMAIGGMVGGGIFSVLGTAVLNAGSLTFVSFTLAGILALITGISYSRLTVAHDEPGGSFIFVEKSSAPRHVAGTLSWFLILGYMFTISLYAYTFGAYLGRLIGVQQFLNPVLGVLIIGTFVVLTLRGVRESGLTEDLLVYGKVAILVVTIVVGMIIIGQESVYPSYTEHPLAVISTAALIFVAYEGFQLLAYDYDDIENKKRNLPRAIMISILVVIALYALISFVTTATLDEETIRENSEIVLAFVVEPLLGQAGFYMVLIAAALSTASAINATMFALARLGRRVSESGHLPNLLTNRLIAGVPFWFVIMAAGISMSVQFLGDLEQIVTFSSTVFLAVFAVVNFTAYRHHRYQGWKRVLPMIGTGGCLVALSLLILDLIQNEPQTLMIVVIVTIVVLAARLIYIQLEVPPEEE